MGWLIKLEHVDKEHERLKALGINGYRDIVLNGVTLNSPKDGYIDLPENRYDVIKKWKEGRLNAPEEPINENAYDFYLSSTGLGDAINGYYAACGLANSTRRKIKYHAHSHTWFSRVSHPFVEVLPQASIGIDASPFEEYMNRLKQEKPTFSHYYADRLSEHLTVKPFKPCRPNQINNAPKEKKPKTIVLSPLACYVSRVWNKWTDLILALEKLGYEVIATTGNGPVIGGEINNQPAMLKKIMEPTHSKYFWGLSAEDMMEKMAASDLVIGNDSGIVHVAGMLNIPAIAIHAGAFSHSFLYGLAPSVTSVMPTEAVGKSDHNTKALNSVSLETVLEAVKAKLEKPKGCQPCKARALGDWKMNEAPKLWAELHARAKAFKGDANGVVAEGNWLKYFADRIKCDECKEHWEKLTKEFPPTFDNYYGWTVAAHNKVNERIGKPQWKE